MGYRLDYRGLSVLEVLSCARTSGRGWVWNVLVVRLRYVRWLLLGWLRVYGLCEYCGVRAGRFGWGHDKSGYRMCYRCWSYYD